MPDPITLGLDTNLASGSVHFPANVNLSYENDSGLSTDSVRVTADTAGGPGLSFAAITTSPTGLSTSTFNATLAPLLTSFAVAYNSSATAQQLAWTASDRATLWASGYDSGHSFSVLVNQLPTAGSATLQSTGSSCQATSSQTLQYDASQVVGALNATFVSADASLTATISQLARHVNLTASASNGTYALDTNEAIGSLSLSSTRLASTAPGCGGATNGYSQTAVTLTGLPLHLSATAPPGGASLWVNASTPIGALMGYQTSNPNATQVAANVSLLTTQNAVVLQGTTQFFGANIPSLTSLAVQRLQNGSTLIQMHRGAPLPFTLSVQDTHSSLQAIANALPSVFNASFGPGTNFSYAGNAGVSTFSASGQQGTTAFTINASGLPSSLGYTENGGNGTISGTLSGSAGIAEIQVSLADPGGLGGTSYTTATAQLNSVPPVVSFAAAGGPSPTASIDAENQSIGTLMLTLSDGSPIMVPNSDYVVFTNTPLAHSLAVRIQNLQHADYAGSPDGTLHANLTRTAAAAFYANATLPAGFIELNTTALPAAFAASVNATSISYSASSGLPDLTGTGALNGTSIGVAANGLPARANLTLTSNGGGLLGAYSASQSLSSVALTLQNPQGLFGTNYTSLNVALFQVPTQLNVSTTGGASPRASIDAGNQFVGTLLLTLSDGSAINVPNSDYVVVTNTSNSHAVALRLQNLRHADYAGSPDGSLQANVTRAAAAAFYVNATLPAGFIALNTTALPSSFSVSANLTSLSYNASSSIPDLTGIGLLNGTALSVSATGLPSGANLALTTAGRSFSGAYTASQVLTTFALSIQNPQGLFGTAYTTMNLALSQVPTQLSITANLGNNPNATFDAGAGAVGSATFVLTDGAYLAFPGSYAILYNADDSHFIAAHVVGLQHFDGSLGPTSQTVTARFASAQAFDVYYRGYRLSGQPAYLAADVRDLPAQFSLNMTSSATCPGSSPGSSLGTPGCVQYSSSSPISSLAAYTNMRAGALTYFVADQVPTGLQVSWLLGSSSSGYLEGHAAAPVTLRSVYLVNDAFSGDYWYADSITLQDLKMVFGIWCSFTCLTSNDYYLNIDTKGNQISGYIQNPSIDSFVMRFTSLNALNWQVLLIHHTGFLGFGCYIEEEEGVLNTAQFGYAFGRGALEITATCVGTNEFLIGIISGSVTVSGTTRTYTISSFVPPGGGGVSIPPLPWSGMTERLSDVDGTVVPSVFTPASGTLTSGQTFSVQSSTPGVLTMQLLYNGSVLWEHAFGAAEASQDDAGSGMDAPSSVFCTGLNCTFPPSVASGLYHGTVNTTDSIDLFAITAKSGDYLRLTLTTTPETGLNLYLLDSLGNQVSGGASSWPAGYLNEIRLAAPSNGTFYVKVALASGFASNYDFSVEGASRTSGDFETVQYIFNGTLSAGASPRFNVTIPPNTANFSAVLQMPGAVDFDLSVWDESGARTGGWTATEHFDSNSIQYATYSGDETWPEIVSVNPLPDHTRQIESSSACGDSASSWNGTACGPTWQVGAWDYAGSGSYSITVTLQVLR